MNNFYTHNMMKKNIHKIKRELKNFSDNDSATIEDLTRAVLDYDSDEVERLIKEEGVDPNEADSEGYTPIGLAIEMRDDERLKQLVKLGADINARDYVDYALEYCPCDSGGDEDINVYIASEVIRHGGKPTGATLISAIKFVDENKEEAVDMLLRCKVDPNFKDSDGTTPLLCAIKYGNLAVVKKLVEAGAKVEDNAFELAEKDGHTKILSYLKQAGDKKDSKHFSTLRDESPEGKSNEEVLAEKVKIINDRLHSHNYISEKENYSAEQIIDFLEEQLDLGYLPDNAEIAADHLISVLEYLTGKSDRRPRSLAVYQPADLICSKLEDYQRDGDLDQLYNDSICWEDAIKRGDLDQLQIQYAILDGGCYAPEKDYTNHPIDKDSHTGLWVAVTQPDPNIEVIKFLLNKGADIKQWSDQGYPSHWTRFNFDMLEEAIKNIENEDKAIEVAKLLIDAGAKVDEYYSQPVLDIAKEKGFKKLAKFLKEHGAVGDDDEEEVREDNQDSQTSDKIIDTILDVIPPRVAKRLATYSTKQNSDGSVNITFKYKDDVKLDTNRKFGYAGRELDELVRAIKNAGVDVQEYGIDAGRSYYGHNDGLGRITLKKCRLTK